MNLSRKLKKQRTKNKLTQEYVADYLHVSRKTISSWENGHGYPNEDYLYKINQLYGAKLKKDKLDNNILFKILYYSNTILFILSIFSLITGFIKIITIIQLIIVIFIVINYSNNNKFNTNKKLFILSFSLVLLTIFVIVMRNLVVNNYFYGDLKDLPYYLGGFIHSIIITISFFAITVYKSN